MLDAQGFCGTRPKLGLPPTQVTKNEFSRQPRIPRETINRKQEPRVHFETRPTFDQQARLNLATPKTWFYP